VSAAGGAGRTRIKICGVTSVETARAAVDAGADAIGVVLVPDSPRFVNSEQVESIAAVLPASVGLVGVFRNADPAELLPPRVFPFDFVQLHGDEDEATVSAAGQDVIRGIPFDPPTIRRWGDCPSVGFLLIDGPAPGSGTGFDHAALARLMPGIGTPVILAGGLCPQSVAEAIAVVRPFAVDVSSGVETVPGVKDPRRIEAFCDAVRRADAGG
jgi:phosphoribosylanthranilate isomerase